jgi:hypothetical protein
MSEQDTVTKLINAHQKRAKKSLYWVARKLLGFKDVNMRTHGEIIAALESNDKRKLIVQPRGSLKSSLACVAYPIWRLINDPNLRVLIESEVYTNSSKFLREIKLHLERPIFTHIFGEFKSNIWNESEIVINQRTSPKKEGSITVGSQGMVKVGAHFDLIINDDMNSPKNSNTPENAEKVIDHYKYNTSILEPTGTYVIIGTRYSANDLIGHILTNEIQQGSDEDAS